MFAGRDIVYVWSTVMTGFVIIISVSQLYWLALSWFSLSVNCNGWLSHGFLCQSTVMAGFVMVISV